MISKHRETLSEEGSEERLEISLTYKEVRILENLITMYSRAFSGRVFTLEEETRFIADLHDVLTNFVVSGDGIIYDPRRP